MEVKKRFSTICIIVLCIFGVLFFVNQGPRRIRLMTPSEKTIKKDVKHYLKDKYDKEFVVLNIDEPSNNYPCYEIYVEPFKENTNMEQRVLVRGFKANGIIHYYDNYAAIKLVPKFKKYICDMTREYYDDTKVYINIVRPVTHYSDLACNCNLQEYLKWEKNNNIEIVTYRDGLKNNNINEISESLIQEMASRDIRGRVNIYIMENKNDYDVLPSINCNFEIKGDCININSCIYNENKYDIEID